MYAIKFQEPHHTKGNRKILDTAVSARKMVPASQGNLFLDHM